MEKKFYVLNDGESIFMRFNTSAFGSKWCGLWKLPYKYVEYYAFRINSEWLSPEKCHGFAKNGNSAEHLYKTENFEATERISLGNGMTVELEVKNVSETPKHIEVSMETGINIRKYSENKHWRDYRTSAGKAEIEVSNELGSIEIGSGHFSRKGEQRTHSPGLYHGWEWDEGEQSVFVPGELTSNALLKKGQKKSFYFHFSRPFTEKTENTFFCNGLGILAGFPWFLQPWARDTGIVLQHFNDAKKFRETLEILLKNSKDGRVPNAIYPDSVLYNSADANPWFIISLHRYLSISKDNEFLEKNSRKIANLLKSGLKRGAVYSYPKESWMDTLDREGFCIEIQSLWAEAFRCAHEMFRNERYKKRSDELIGIINTKFWTGKFYKDRMESYTRTSNVLFPLYFGQIPKKRAETVFKALEEEFTTPRGILTVSRKDIMFHPSDYHLGRVWGMLTSLMHYAEKRYSRNSQAEKYRKIIESNRGLRCIDGIDETYEPDTGKPRGCCNQAWSHLEA